MAPSTTMPPSPSKGKCTRALRNTLTTDCYNACPSNRPPLCVNYAQRPANETEKVGDGNYYYQGCAYTMMPTCVKVDECELQCLQTKNEPQEEWILDVSQPQADRLETSLFKYVEKLQIPKTLKRLRIVGTTEQSRKVPMTFADDAFASGSGLQKITILDLGVGRVASNLFPVNLDTLVMQRTQLTLFEPVGSRRLPELRSLDLSGNDLQTIPSVVYEMKNLTTLNLLENPLRNVRVSPSQLAFLRRLDKFEATMLVTECTAGYSQYTWDSKTVCYSGTDKSMDNVGSIPDAANPNSSSSASASSNSTTMIIIAAMIVVTILAIVAGVFFLKRAKLRAHTTNNADAGLATAQRESASTAEGKSTAQKPKNKIGTSVRTLLTQLSSQDRSNDLADPLHGGVSPTRKATFREIAAAEIRESSVLVQTSVVTVSLAEYNRARVTLHRLRVSDDAAENCEAALSVTPVISQLRHPQLLSVVGLMWEDVHTMSAVCEDMNRGTLEDFLIASTRGSNSHGGGSSQLSSSSTSVGSTSTVNELTWQNFKLRAALDIARCLMYLHTQHRLTYNGLCGKTVLVDSEKGCKLSTMIAALPTGLMRPHKIKSMRAFCAPEVLAGEPPLASSDMYSFGVLLAQLDTCETANDMIRSTLRQQGNQTLTDSFVGEHSSARTNDDFSNSNDSACSISTSLLSMFTFTSECPPTVRELAASCLQYDPSMRPSAQYMTAMLQQLQHA